MDTMDKILGTLIKARKIYTQYISRILYTQCHAMDQNVLIPLVVSFKNV